MVSSSCKPQVSQNRPDSIKPSNQSFIALMKYCDTHLYQLSSDSLIYYVDTLFRYSYRIDTTGSDCNSLMIDLLEQALKKDQSSTKAANRLFKLYTVTKQYEKAIEVSNAYLNDTSNIAILLGKSMMYYKIGEIEKADSGFNTVRARCEKVQDNPKLKKEYYLGKMWMLSLVIFIQEGKERSLLNFKSVKDKYPDDIIVSGLYEKIKGFNNVNDLIEDNLQ